MKLLNYNIVVENFTPSGSIRNLLKLITLNNCNTKGHDNKLISGGTYSIYYNISTVGAYTVDVD